MKKADLSLEDLQRDFVCLPEYDNLYISKDGRMARVYVSEVSGTLFDNRYLRVTYKNKYGRYSQKTVAMMFAEAFIKQGKLSRQETVIHKDGNYANNSIDNLQIVEGNCGRKALVARDDFRCVETGKIYKRLIDAAKEYGCNSRNILNALEGKAGVASGKHWEYLNIETPKFIKKEVISPSKETICLETREVFRSSLECAKKLGVTKQAINQAVYLGTKAGGFHFDHVKRERKILVGDVRNIISDRDWETWNHNVVCSKAELKEWAKYYLRKKSGDANIVVEMTNDIRFPSGLVCVIEETPRLQKYIDKRRWRDMADKMDKYTFNQPVWYSIDDNKAVFRNRSGEVVNG